MYAATWTEYVLPDEAAAAVFETVAAGTAVTSFFAGGAGSAGDPAFTGMVSTALTSLAGLTVVFVGVVFVGVEDAVAVTAGIDTVTSPIGGFAEAIDAAGEGQR